LAAAAESLRFSWRSFDRAFPPETSPARLAGLLFPTRQPGSDAAASHVVRAQVQAYVRLPWSGVEFFLLEISQHCFAVLASVPKRPLHRQGNVSSVELLGARVWS
jgi:hypothetical protein